MSNRRNLKKEISASMNTLHKECEFYKVFTKNAVIEKADKIIKSIRETESDLIKRLSASEGKELRSRTKAYYRKLKSDLKEQTARISKEIHDLD